MAAGAIFKQFLAVLTIHFSRVVAIGKVSCPGKPVNRENWQQLQQDLKNSAVHCADPQASKDMMEAIDAARRDGESLGGCFEVGTVGIPPGLGSHVPGMQNWTLF